jgi:hypothetical protein
MEENMSLIRVPTKAFLALLADLALTSGDDGDTAGVLLHSARGYVDPTEPGVTDLIVGTSCSSQYIGHTWNGAHGQTAPMLWPLNDVHAVISVFKVLAKGQKEHSVDIRREGDEITVAEDPTLFGETSLRFTAADLTKYPRDRWQVLKSGLKYTNPHETEPSLRTDFEPKNLALFVKIAKTRGETLQLYRSHQRSPVLVQIGDTYRGALMPSTRWDRDTPKAGEAPSTDLYVPVLPDLDEVA